MLEGKRELGQKVRIRIQPYGNLLKFYAVRAKFVPNPYCVITPEGRCHIDCLLPFVYGNLRRESLAEIWNKYLKYGWRRKEVIEFVETFPWHDVKKASFIPYLHGEILIGD